MCSGAATQPGPTANRAKGKILSYLLVPIMFVFVLCCAQQQTQATDFSSLSMGLPGKVDRKALSNRDTDLQTLLVPREDLDRGSQPTFAKRQYVSKVLNSGAKPKGNSSDYLSNLLFGHQNWTDNKPLLDSPVRFQPDQKSSSEVKEFLSVQDLSSTPFDTDGLSPYLHTSPEVIEEAKRVQFNLFQVCVVCFS